MTIARFQKIAQLTSIVFWPAVYQHVSTEEATYLRNSPAAQRNLKARLVRSLAETLLSPDQLIRLKNIDIVDLQPDLPNPKPKMED